ncbi:MAG: RnfABCDGE type electron transport complex subunit D [Bacteroidales bacterium]|jgi:electron transport complex protein RnfD|nr:RnfABCDGE type electron transport complex subunit D [Bacteroidales bacterium]MDI9575022.1 RnfABCDGE type electron transport complex subunit D [Bacteroidota bacterium]HPZ74389.1 RnfABCDGE type electron transport complex subunit D [Candidatus Pacearchaeota archaeon]MDD3755947.1 RnfABCDGE type electron transport complex subunit D [Bacteroidales bacterium]MDY0401075.1 RnfABCDGE type electron transport complex subunit D [Bacteroidales bacterium]
MDKKFIISGSPHIYAKDNVQRIMLDVVIALIPATLGAFYFFGLGAVRVFFVSVVTCLIFEYLIQKFLLKQKPTINDLSAIVTGMLLAFNVPSNLPTWVVIIGSLIAIGIGKMVFGGLGQNLFNPALVARVFLLISFPVYMTSWPKPIASAGQLSDVVTGPTPLGILKESGSISAASQTGELPSYVDMMLGNMGGSMGEVSAILLLIGAIYLLYRKVITLHIPLSYILTVIIFTGIFWLIDPTKYADPLFHLLTGGLILGAFFMATDMVTSPTSYRGQIIFGIGCGVLTALIRLFGAYPEGVSFSILIMNAFVPLIDRISYKHFGEVKA